MRILIVEDEALIARRVERLSREILGDRIEHLKAVATLQEALRHLAEHPVDVLLLDLNLNGRDGFELLKTSAAGAFHTIVVSANTDQALRAFEYGVLDFIGKPFNRARLARAYDRLLDAGRRADYAARYLAVRRTGRIDLIPVADVRYVKGAGSYAELVLHDGSTALHDKSLDRLIALLPPVFERIHKSYIVAMDGVVSLHRYEGSRYEVELRDGTRLPVGRTRYKEIMARLDE